MAKRKTKAQKEAEEKKAAAEAKKADKAKAKSKKDAKPTEEAPAAEATASETAEAPAEAAEGQDDKHESIRDFMAREASGEGNTGKSMKYDPKLKRFVIVDEDDKTADDLPPVTPEDLQSF